MFYDIQTLVSNSMQFLFTDKHTNKWLVSEQFFGIIIINDSDLICLHMVN